MALTIYYGTVSPLVFYTVIDLQVRILQNNWYYKSLKYLHILAYMRQDIVLIIFIVTVTKYLSNLHKKGSTYLDWRDVAYHSRNIWQQKPDVTGHTVAASKKERIMIAGAHLARVILFDTGSQPVVWCYLHLVWLLPAQLNLGRNILMNRPRGIPLVIVNLVKYTMMINHPRTSYVHPMSELILVFFRSLFWLRSSSGIILFFSIVFLFL